MSWARDDRNIVHVFRLLSITVLTNLTELSTSWGANSRSASQSTPSHFRNPNILRKRSPMDPIPIQSIHFTHFISIPSILILYCHVHTSILSSIFPSDFQTTLLHGIFISQIYATWPTHHTVLYFMTNNNWQRERAALTAEMILNSMTCLDGIQCWDIYLLLVYLTTISVAKIMWSRMIRWFVSKELKKYRKKETALA
jgi:hypothetical protein